MTRRVPITAISAPVSIVLVTSALGAILLAQGQTSASTPGAQNPRAAQTAGAPDAATIMGQVTRLAVEEGDRVKKRACLKLS